jgi:hypothetical protein
LNVNAGESETPSPAHEEDKIPENRNRWIVSFQKREAAGKVCPAQPKRESP